MKLGNEVAGAKDHSSLCYSNIGGLHKGKLVKNVSRGKPTTTKVNWPTLQSNLLDKIIIAIQWKRTEPSKLQTPARLAILKHSMIVSFLIPPNIFIRSGRNLL